VRVLIVVLLVLILGSVLWDASEQHYTACVTKAEAQNPIISGAQASNDIFANGPTLSDRKQAINDCSRWPF
jgi:hypothetical protein